MARRTFEVTRTPLSFFQVDIWASGEMPDAYAGLDVIELRSLVEAARAALLDHPQRDHVVGPDGHLWCANCSQESYQHDECEGAGCRGDNDAARYARAEFDDGGDS
jgi:hypothetical protein